MYQEKIKSVLFKKMNELGVPSDYKEIILDEMKKEGKFDIELLNSNMIKEIEAGSTIEEQLSAFETGLNFGIENCDSLNL